MVRRAAFTLIELIFAIVIVAISVVSLPMMNQVINKGVDANLVQEAIFAAATELNEAVRANWDEASVDALAPNSYARVVDHVGNCDDNNASATYRQMPGHITEPLHRKCIASSAVTPIDAGLDVNIDSLDDMVHVSEDIFIDTTKDASGYKQVYKSTIDVTRNIVYAGTANPDIKRITITVNNEDGDIITKLRTYSANIGEVDYLKKAY